MAGSPPRRSQTSPSTTAFAPDYVTTAMAMETLKGTIRTRLICTSTRIRVGAAAKTWKKTMTIQGRISSRLRLARQRSSLTRIARRRPSLVRVSTTAYPVGFTMVAVDNQGLAPAVFTLILTDGYVITGNVISVGIALQ